MGIPRATESPWGPGPTPKADLQGHTPDLEEPRDLKEPCYHLAREILDFPPPWRVTAPRRPLSATAHSPTLTWPHHQAPGSRTLQLWPHPPCEWSGHRGSTDWPPQDSKPCQAQKDSHREFIFPRSRAETSSTGFWKRRLWGWVRRGGSQRTRTAACYP